MCSMIEQTGDTRAQAQRRTASTYLDAITGALAVLFHGVMKSFIDEARSETNQESRFVDNKVAKKKTAKPSPRTGDVVDVFAGSLADC